MPHYLDFGIAQLAYYTVHAIFLIRILWWWRFEVDLELACALYWRDCEWGWLATQSRINSNEPSPAVVLVPLHLCTNKGSGFWTNSYCFCTNKIRWRRILEKVKFDLNDKMNLPVGKICMRPTGGEPLTPAKKREDPIFQGTVSEEVS